jgi:hypothetical protein
MKLSALTLRVQVSELGLKEVLYISLTIKVQWPPCPMILHSVLAMAGGAPRVLGINAARWKYRRRSRLTVSRRGWVGAVHGRWRR